MDELYLKTMIAKDKIRELALLYCRGVDRKDAELLRELYTEDATDTHGDTFDGDAESFVQFLEQSFPYVTYSGHHVCNHTIDVQGDTAEGEVYALAYHIFPDGKGGYMEDFMCVRYLDHYRYCNDKRWRFAKRVVSYDIRKQGPTHVLLPEGSDPTLNVLTSRLFQMGARAS